MNKKKFPSRLAGVVAALALSASSFAALVEYPGYVKVETFEAIGGDNVVQLTAAPKYISNLVDSVLYVPSLHWARNPSADNYGSRFSGFITPDETTNYVFFVASDNSASFYLSTDATPANLKLIAADQGWQNQRAWTGVGGTSSGENTTNVVFRRGFNPGAAVLETNGFQWVGPFQNRSDQFLNSPLSNLVTTATPRWPVTNAQGNAVITLTAGQKYYFEVLFKEGGGGDYASVAWKKSYEDDPANGAPEIMGQYLSVMAPDQITITRQPQSVSVLAGQPVNLTVDIAGVPGETDPATSFLYQWYVNDSAILDGSGNARNFSIPSPTVADHNGKRYFLVVQGLTTGLMATSQVATVTVSQDNQAPRITKVRSSEDFRSAVITFSEPLQDSAVDPANYVFSNGLTVEDANFLIVTNVPANDNPKFPENPLNRQAVVLFTSAQAENGVYNLTVNNVKDLAGNNLTPNTNTLYGHVFRAGVINYKRWEYNSGSVNALLGNALRFAAPTMQATVTTAETPNYNNNNTDYVQRMSGYFIPPTNGNYQFFASADNNAFLYLSSDSTPANLKLIAADVGWQNQRTWVGVGGVDNGQNPPARRGDGTATSTGPFANQSDEFLTSARFLTGAGLPTERSPWTNVNEQGNAVITLTAGQRYLFHMWHEEFDGGRFEFTYKLESEADPANGSVSRVTGNNLIGALVDPTSLLPTITAQPTNIMNFTLGGSATFNVTANSFIPVTYQWFKDGVAIPGATNATFTTNNLTLGGIGSYYVVVSNDNGSVTSSRAAALTSVTAPGLTFQQDSTGTVVIEAERYFAATAGTDGKVWVPLSGRTGASGSGYMGALPDTGANIGNGIGFLTNAARLDYKVNFTATGTNYLWIRGGDPFADGAGDSVHAGIDLFAEAAGIQITGAPGFNTTGWNWVGTNSANGRVTLIVTNAGVHTVSLWMREDGFLADKILITTNANFTPTGTGPAESALATLGPTLTSLRNAQGQVVITYTGTLLSSTNVAAGANGYTAVSGATGGTYTVPAGAPSRQFFISRE